MTGSPESQPLADHWYSAILETSDSDHQNHFKARSDAAARRIASEWFAKKVGERIAKRGSCTVLKYELHGLSERKAPTVPYSPVSDFRPEVIERARINPDDFTFCAFEPGGKESA